MGELKVSNPSAFGFVSFGITTILLALFFTGIFDENMLGIVFSTGLFAGGLAPLILGVWSLKQERTFEATVFLLGAIFWFSYIFIYFLQRMGLVPVVTDSALWLWVQVPYFFLWGLFTFWLFLSSMRTNRVVQLYLFFQAIFFWLVALGHWFFWDSSHSGPANPSINIIAGYIGIVCGLIAIYYGMALIMNSTYGRDVMPIWRVKEGT